MSGALRANFVLEGCVISVINIALLFVYQQITRETANAEKRRLEKQSFFTVRGNIDR